MEVNVQEVLSLTFRLFSTQYQDPHQPAATDSKPLALISGKGGHH